MDLININEVRESLSKLHKERFSYPNLIDKLDKDACNKMLANIIEEFVEYLESPTIEDNIDALVDTFIFADNSLRDLGITEFNTTHNSSISVLSILNKSIEYLRGEITITNALIEIRVLSYLLLRNYGNADKLLQVGVNYIAQRNQDPDQKLTGRKLGEKWLKDRTQKLEDPDYSPYTFKTCNFANISKLPFNVPYHMIDITRFSPKWSNFNTFKELAPSKELLSEYKDGLLTPEEFTEVFMDQLSYLDKSEVIAELHEMSDNKVPVLLCYCKDGEFCHRNLVLKWLTSD